MMSRKKIYKTVPFLVLGMTLVYLLNHYYTETVEDTRSMFDLTFVEKYLLTNPTAAGEDLPRLQRLTIMFHLMGNDIGAILFGMGYGLIGGGNILGASRAGRSLYYLVSGSRILLFRLWIQGGLIAVLLMAADVFYFMRSKVATYVTLRRFRWFLFFSLMLTWVYSEAVLDRVFGPIVAFMIMWLSTGGIEGERQEALVQPMNGDSKQPSPIHHDETLTYRQS
jgi:hypothetical protein